MHMRFLVACGFGLFLLTLSLCAEDPGYELAQPVSVPMGGHPVQLPVGQPVDVIGNPTPDSKGNLTIKFKLPDGSASMTQVPAASVVIRKKQQPVNVLVAADGTKYEYLSIIAVEPDGIKLETDSGIVKVPFVLLSKELQSQYGYDPQKAAEYIKQESAARALQQQKNETAALTRSGAGLPGAFNTNLTDAQKETMELLTIAPWKISPPTGGWSATRKFSSNGTFATYENNTEEGWWRFSEKGIVLYFPDKHIDLITIPLDPLHTVGADAYGRPVIAAFAMVADAHKEISVKGATSEITTPMAIDSLIDQCGNISAAPDLLAQIEKLNVPRIAVEKSFEEFQKPRTAGQQVTWLGIPVDEVTVIVTGGRIRYMLLNFCNSDHALQLNREAFNALVKQVSEAITKRWGKDYTTSDEIVRYGHDDGGLYIWKDTPLTLRFDFTLADVATNAPYKAGSIMALVDFKKTLPTPPPDSTAQNGSH